MDRWALVTGAGGGIGNRDCLRAMWVPCARVGTHRLLHFAGGLDVDFAGSHRGREPQHLVSAGIGLGSRPIGRGGANRHVDSIRG